MHDLQVTGETTEEQILESLRRYSQRSVYAHRALFHLFGLTRGFAEARIDIMKVILLESMYLRIINRYSV